MERVLYWFDLQTSWRMDQTPAVIMRNSFRLNDQGYGLVEKEIDITF